MTTSQNARQAEFWNAEPGRNWAAWQRDLDHVSSAVLDLLLAAAMPQPGENVLDIGCGAGTSTFTIGAKVAPGGRVLGVDISQPLVARAEERKAGNETGAGVSFTLADAQEHPFERGMFDLAVSRFGVMFFADSVAAFANVGTALRTGGRLAFAAWAGPEHNPWFTVPQRAAVARLGPVAPAPAEAPGPLAFRDAERVLAILERAGFSDGRASGKDFEMHHPGGLDAAVNLLANVGPINGVVREKQGTPEDKAAILDAVAAEFDGYRSDDGIRIPGRVNIFTARMA